MIKRDYSAVNRKLSLLDNILVEAQHMLCTLTGQVLASRPSPADAAEVMAAQAELTLQPDEKQHAAQLMRINHTGEVCAQALYQGQAFVARDTHTRDVLLRAGHEEQDHLVWCARRVAELGARTSVFSPIFYVASFVMGATVARASDAISMGFIEETEQQVWRHLQGHIKELSVRDVRSRAIIEVMQADEIQHAEQARANGAVALPAWARWSMSHVSKLMTLATRWV